VQHALRDQPPLVLTALGPGIGIEDENPRQRPRRQRFDQRACVAGPQADIVEPLFLDAGQRLGDAVDERLAADEADITMRPGLRQQMLAAAKADLEPDFLW
jgi:hypothetical protein